MVHVSGEIECKAVNTAGLSMFSCVNYEQYIYVTITTNSKAEIFLPSNITFRRNQKYELPGYDYYSDEVIWFGYNHKVAKGKILKIWHTQDYADSTEHDNSGTHCVDVYIKIN